LKRLVVREENPETPPNNAVLVTAAGSRFGLNPKGLV